MGVSGLGALVVIGYYVCQCRILSPQLAGFPHGRVTPLKRLTAERQAHGAVWLRETASVCSAFVMAAAAAGAAAEESACVAAIAMSVPNSTGGCPGAEGEGVEAAGEEKDAAPKGAEVVGDSEEDGDDVFEVEKILDMKCEGVRSGLRGEPGRGAWGEAGRDGVGPLAPRAISDGTLAASVEDG